MSARTEIMLRRWAAQWPILTLAVLAALSLVLLEWSHRQWRTTLQVQVTALDNLSQARRRVTLGYLIAGRAASGDSTFQLQDAQAHLDRAIQALDDWQRGESTLIRMQGAPPPGATLVAEIQSYQAGVAAFQRLLLPPSIPDADRVTQRTAFAELERHAGRLEGELYTTLGRVLLAQERNHLVILILWGTTLALVGVTLHREAATRHRATVQLQHSEARVEGMLQSAMDAIIAVDAEQRIVLFNGAAERLFGYPGATMIGEPFARLLPERHQGLIHEFETAGVTARATDHLQLLSAQRADGDEFPIEASIAQVVVDGEPLLTVILRDITQRRAAEAEREELLAREHAARAAAERASARAMHLQMVTASLAGLSDQQEIIARIVEHVGATTAADTIAIGLRTPDGAALEMLRLPAGEPYRDTPWRQMLLQLPSAITDAVRLKEPIFLRDPEERDRHYPGLGQLGVALHSAIATYPLRSEGEVIGVLALAYAEPQLFPPEERVFLDTLAQQCAQALNRAQLTAARTRERQAKDEALALLDTLFASAPVGLAFVDRDLRFVRINDALAAIDGVSAQKHLGKTIHTVLPELAPIIAPLYKGVLVSGQPVVNHELRGTTPAAPGEQHHWLANYYPVPGPEGPPLGVGIVVLDITERKRLQATLEQREAQLAGIIGSAMDAIITVDTDQRIVLFNAAAEQTFGYPTATILGQPLALLLPESSPAAHPLAAVSLGEGTTMRPTPRHDDALSGRRRDGSVFPIESSVSTFMVDGQQLSTMILRDVTARKRLEAQYLQAQKMETVGRLAGGIAHDFNNLLTVIGGYTELMRDDLAADEPLAADLNQIQGAVDRAVRLTRQLLAFARKQVIAPVMVDLNQLLRDLTPLLARLLGADVMIETALAPGLGLVRVDPGQLEQVIVNLAVNARDAMPGGGRLAIETANLTLDEVYAQAEPAIPSGEYVVLRVNDTGVGIPKELQPRVFEPFFTTKGPDKGTGLGLATCYGIVQQHGGMISLSSEPGVGTTVVIYLPRVVEEQAGATTATASVVPPQGSETVLLVEDEAAVRALAVRVLQQHGYTVLEAANGLEALEVVEAWSPRPIDLLVTDVVMPELGGPALAERLGALLPGLKVLFISGYTEHPMLHQSPLSAEVALLQKPFSPAVLTHTVRTILDR